MRGVILHCCCVVDHFYPHAVGFASVLILARAHCSCLVAVDTIFDALKCFFRYPSYFSSSNITRNLRNPFTARTINFVTGKGPRGKVISRSQQGHYPSSFVHILNSDLFIFTYLVLM